MLRRLAVILTFILVTTAVAVSAADPVDVSYREKSDENYIFRVKGSDQRFLLLDTGNDGNSKFLLMGIDFYGKSAFDESGYQRFDPDASSNIAYKLNKKLTTEGLKEGHTKKIYKLPENVVEHIDFNHTWTTEGGKKDGDCPYEYKVKCGVALLSQTEFLKYQDKIGWRDELFDKKYTPTGLAWLLRTGRSTAEMAVLRSDINNKTTSWLIRDTNVQIRPVFWVDRSFFANVAIDLETAGKYVKDIFKQYHTVGELKEIYSEAEIYDYLDYTAPIQLSGTLSVNGKGAKNINGAEYLSAEIHVVNHLAAAQSGIIVVTYYDEYGQAIDMNSQPILLGSKEQRKCTLELTLGAVPAKGAYVGVSFISRKMPTVRNSNSIRYYCE